MFLEVVIFVVSMAALIYGADFIIKEAEKIALHFNISHYVIGATLVAFGTSLPEMAASMVASYHHKTDMAVANVIGSVTFNITLVLGVVFLLSKKMHPKRDLFNLDSAWIVMPVVLFFLMIQDGVVGRFDAVLFLLLMASYIIFLFGSAKEVLEAEIGTDDIDTQSFRWLPTVALLIVGFTLTVGGANYAVESGSQIARGFGVSEWLIGLFLLAFGTSLPELVVSVVAAKKGNAEMSIGNIIGSNVANFSMVLGSAALINPLSIDLEASSFDLYILTAASLALLFILANKLYNKAGAIFLLLVFALFVQNAFAA